MIKQKVAFLGLGLMGGSMAANLASKGYQVLAWNRTSDRPGVKIAVKAGAKLVDSIEEAVQEATIVFSCVGDVPDVQSVLLGDRGVIKLSLIHI